MLLTVLFIVIAVSTNLIKEVNTKPVEGLDIENFLRSLQQQLQLEQLHQQKKQKEPKHDDRAHSSSSDDDSTSDEYKTGSLGGQDVERLINLVQGDRDDRNKRIQLYKVNDNDDRGDVLDEQLLQQLNVLQNGNKKRQNRDARNIQLQLYKDDYNDDRSNGLDQQLVQQLNLLQQTQDRYKKRQNKAQDGVMKQYHSPNSLLGPVGPVMYDDRSNILLQSLNNDEGYEDLDPNEYSNIYVILNPDAVQKSQNKESLNDLLSNLLSSSNQGIKDGRERGKDGRYKGFFVKDRNTLMRRRRNRESREIYAKGNSIEDSRPKRSRGERGGGGGGGGGRTAIPYIRHHGDNIYEKDD